MKVSQAKIYMKKKPFIEWFKREGGWIGFIDGTELLKIEKIHGVVRLETKKGLGASFETVLNAMKRAHLHIIVDLSYTKNKAKYLPTYLNYFDDMLHESHSSLD
jgi:hypothetical protein